MRGSGRITGTGAIVGCAAIGCAVAAFAGGEIAGGALRALSLVAMLGCAGFALDRSRARAVTGAPALSIAERHFVAKDVGVALVVVEGRRLVIGYAPAGVALVTELAPASRGERAP